MSRTCTICSHEKRGDIEAAVVAGTSYRDIARRFETSKDAIARHASEHIRASLRASEVVKEEARGLDVVKQLKDINATTLAILASVKSETGKEFLAL